MIFPVLSVIVFTPVAAALIILMMPAERKNLVRAYCISGSGPGIIFLVMVSYLRYDQNAAGYQFIEQYNWLPALGISLYFGVDGMSTPLVLLTGVVMFTGVLISWGEKNEHVSAGIQDRPREFFAFLFLLASGVFGVFVSLDLFMLFFFYEIAVFPMYLLIAIWGWVQTREYAAMKLTLYLFMGSVVAWLVRWQCTGWQARTPVCTPLICFNLKRPGSRPHSKTLVPAGLLWLCGIGRHLAVSQLVA